MSAPWTDSDARMQRMLDGLTAAQIALLDVQRALFAEREAREKSRLLVHDGSAIPDDVPRMGTSCDDEPPEAR